MRIVILITVIELSALMVWMIYKHYRQELIPVVSGDRSYSPATARRINQRSMGQIAPYMTINDRLLDGQFDDRRPMNGAVANHDEMDASSGRAFARRSHQLMYKRWSQERRDS